jgi:hypothetical protein
MTPGEILITDVLTFAWLISLAPMFASWRGERLWDIALLSAPRTSSTAPYTSTPHKADGSPYARRAARQTIRRPRTPDISRSRCRRRSVASAHRSRPRGEVVSGRFYMYATVH